VLGVAKAWREDRDAVSGQAGRIAATLAEQATPLLGQTPATDLAALSDRAVTTLAADYDEQHGGFGGAPKFPPSMVLEFLLRRSERPAAGQGADGTGQGGDGAGQAGEAAATGGRALAMATGTAHAMARGGMYDQLGGGFARYSVDAGWVVPHFEKMLYDNALLARVYAHLWRRTGDPLARRVAHETCAWMIRELRTPEGGFASALDADSEGQEGLFYTWTPAELTAELGEADGRYAAETFGVTQAGTFEHGRSVLQLRADPAGPDRFVAIRDALLAARERRVRPGRDDKVVAAWNGLAIAALAECGLLLADPVLTTAASDAADLLTRGHLRDQRLARTSRDGVAGPSAGVLEDYACVAEGLLALSGVTGQADWVRIAGQLLDTALTRFSASGGAFYDTADDGEALIYRPADPIDGPTPSGTFATAGALLSYGALTGSARHREAALGALGALAPLAARYPRAAGSGLAVAEAVVAGPAEIAVVGPLGDPRTATLHTTAMLAAPPGAVIALGDGSAVDAGPGPVEVVPLLAGRGLVAGDPSAYVCRDFTCRMPVTDPMELRAALAYPAPAPTG
jgi:uncharacterized protein YyaL (SSP411 family)